MGVVENERRVFGPPGTGKTSTLQRQAERAARARGSDNVIIASFTRAAAEEIGGRRVPVPRSQIGTLHAIAYRALGRPEIAQDPDHVADWNAAMPHWRLSGGSDLDQAAHDIVPDSPGDELMAQVEVMRARRVPVEAWPSQAARTFFRRWCEWKDDRGGLFDFADLIETALTDTRTAPGEPEIGLFDEVQDFTRLELDLVRRWAAKMDLVLLAGDDDQTLYQFRGATPDAFLDPPVDDAHKRVLDRSYRVPAAVHRCAEAWVARLSRREPKRYRPRLLDDDSEAEGRVRLQERATWRAPDPLIDEIEARIAEGRTVMVMATCSYMLEPLRSMLRERAVPFHNPWRRKRGDWNPLAPRRGRSAVDRVLAFLRPDEAMWGGEARRWTARDLDAWVEVVRQQGALVRGAKKEIAELATATGADEPLPWTDNGAARFFTAEAWARARELDLSWLERSVLARSRGPMGFPIEVARRRGAAALRDDPLVSIGTIHCQPPGEPVLTTSGWRPIGDLDPERDWLVGFHAATNSMKTARDHPNSAGSPFVVGTRRFSGDLVRIKTAASEALVTPDHRVRACYDESFYNRWVVYLMRRGPWWRVGMCTSAHMPYRSGGVMGRLATERADASWLLGVYDTREEAIAAEAYFQARWGIPSLRFEASKGNVLSAERIAEVHDSTTREVNARVRQLFVDTGMDPDQPLYVRRPGGKARNMAGYWFTTAAANLIDGRFKVPVVPERFEAGFRPGAERASVTREPYVGEVVSVEVAGGHYVTGGQLTHNSFKGAEAECCFLFPDISTRAARHWFSRGEGRDAIVRQFYVGLTRAREELTVCAPAQRATVQPEELVGRSR